MSKIHAWFGALIVATTFAACGDDEDDGSGGGGSSTGGSAGSSGSGTGGSAGKGGTAGSAGSGGTAGKGGTGGKGGTAGGGAGGTAGMGGEGGEPGGMGGAGGETPEPCDDTAPPAMFIGELSGAQEVPANASTGTGNAIAAGLNAAETELTVSAYWAGLGSNTYIGHIHGPAAPGVNAPVLFDLMPPTGAVSGQVVAKVFAINAAQVAYLKGGQLYVNIHSDTLMDGEIRAQLLPPVVVRSGTLSAQQEVPTNTSAGTGRAVAVVYPGGNQVAVSVTWSGLTGNATVGHVHGPAAVGVNASVAFDLMPPTVAAGSVVHKIWQVTAQNNQDLLNGLMYANIHSAMYPSGEIRAQLVDQCD